MVHTWDNVTVLPLRKIPELAGQENKSHEELGLWRITGWEEREKSKGESISLGFVQVSGLENVILPLVTSDELGQYCFG